MSKEFYMHCDYAPISQCQNSDSYGEVCVKCDRCKRFSALEAAEKIDLLLSHIVKKNTGIETGFFSGVSLQNIADIIIEEINKGENS